MNTQQMDPQQTPTPPPEPAPFIVRPPTNVSATMSKASVPNIVTRVAQMAQAIYNCIYAHIDIHPHALLQLIRFNESRSTRLYVLTCLAQAITCTVLEALILASHSTADAEVYRADRANFRLSDGQSPFLYPEDRLTRLKYENVFFMIFQVFQCYFGIDAVSWDLYLCSWYGGWRKNADVRFLRLGRLDLTSLHSSICDLLSSVSTGHPPESDPAHRACCHHLPLRHLCGRADHGDDEMTGTRQLAPLGGTSSATSARPITSQSSLRGSISRAGTRSASSAHSSYSQPHLEGWLGISGVSGDGCFMDLMLTFNLRFCFDSDLQFGWNIYKRIGADVEMQNAFRIYQIFVLLLKLDGFFEFVFAVFWLAVMAETGYPTSHDPVLVAMFIVHAVLCALNFPALFLARRAVRVAFLTFRCRLDTFRSGQNLRRSSPSSYSSSPSLLSTSVPSYSSLIPSGGFGFLQSVWPSFWGCTYRSFGRPVLHRQLSSTLSWLPATLTRFFDRGPGAIASFFYSSFPPPLPKTSVQRLFDENYRNYVDPTTNPNLGGAGARTATPWTIDDLEATSRPTSRMGSLWRTGRRNGGRTAGRESFGSVTRAEAARAESGGEETAEGARESRWDLDMENVEEAGEGLGMGMVDDVPKPWPLGERAEGEKVEESDVGEVGVRKGEEWRLEDYGGGGFPAPPVSSNPRLTIETGYGKGGFSPMIPNTPRPTMGFVGSDYSPSGFGSVAFITPDSLRPAMGQIGSRYGGAEFGPVSPSASRPAMGQVGYGYSRGGYGEGGFAPGELRAPDTLRSPYYDE
ncbi:hypothetical protein BC938DRAFT_479382 [Jimgerdemannia flammicorona]|uniref:Uncharacterized protein n=1 Tax=Jimgerdemannia flammicorona TaxID=994334 RepID=A0A433QKX6_9FUNG|nr:hypothetical protein BC938DRAFT_479382 [Jimgerdemannia flammicorona]